MVKCGDIDISWKPIQMVMDYDEYTFNTYALYLFYKTPVLGSWSTSQYLPDRFVSLL
jgi:hypothetical protein